MFKTDNNVETAVKRWLREQGTEMCGQRTVKFIPRYGKCLSVPRGAVHKHSRIVTLY